MAAKKAFAETPEIDAEVEGANCDAHEGDEPARLKKYLAARRSVAYTAKVRFSTASPNDSNCRRLLPGLPQGNQATGPTGGQYESICD